MAETTKKKYGDWRDEWTAGEYLHKDPDYVEGTHEAENLDERVLRHLWPQRPLADQTPPETQSDNLDVG